jgi:hypothetical protein
MRGQKQIPSASDWKSHPVVVATIAAVSAIGVSILIFKEIVIPTQTASLQNEIASLRKQLDLPDGEAAGIRTLRKQVETLENSLKQAKADVAIAQLSNLFAIGNPYPIGLGQIKIGDSIEAIEKTYPATSIDRKSAWWSVKGQHAVFDDVTYNFDRNAKDKRVSYILFFMNFDAPVELLKTKLVEALGQPSAIGPKEGCYFWKLDQGLVVRMDRPHSFVLSPRLRECVPD